MQETKIIVVRCRGYEDIDYTMHKIVEILKLLKTGCIRVKDKQEIKLMKYNIIYKLVNINNPLNVQDKLKGNHFYKIIESEQIKNNFEKAKKDLQKLIKTINN